MPRFFASISDAKRALDLLMIVTAHFHHCCASEPFERVRRYAEHHARLSQWEAAFQPLLKKARMEAETHDGLGRFSETKVPTLLLSVCHRIALIILAGAIISTETMYDSLIREFSYIVSTVRMIVEITNRFATISTNPLSLDNTPKPLEQNSKTQHHKSRFTVDVKTLPPLHIVGSKCRDPLLRREAIAPLRQCHVEEGFWAPHSTAEMCSWLMEVEEAGMMVGSDWDVVGASNGGNFFIPEEGRVRLTGLICEPDKRKMWVQCTGAVAVAGLYGQQERPVWEKIVTW